jgi:extracellular elastinolytic metalloproteinase
MLITRGMELSPTEPSMLDMRNAILQADKVAYGGHDQPEIWRVFAHRGMGWYAGSIDGADAFPAQDFHTPPPAQAARASLTGKVTDPTTGNPVAGALVAITGHDSGYLGDYSDVTDGQGNYTINFVLRGKYKKVVVSAPGYEIVSHAVNVQPPSTTRNFKIRFDWAASANGGQITDFNGPDYSAFGCGPDKAIDLTQANGWGSTTGNDAGDPTGVFVPKFIVVKLPQTINIASFAVDPTANCGDPGSSSTGKFRIGTSPDGTTWTTAAHGTFQPGERFKYFEVPATGGTSNVQYVRFWILGNQVPDFATNCPDGPYGGCQFTDLTELEVFGS